MRRLLLIIALVFNVALLKAQYSYTGTTTGTATVSQTMGLTLSNMVGSTSLTSISDYENGKIVTNYITFAIKANKPWILQATVPTLFTAAGGGASTNMPSSIISVRVTGTSTFYTLTNGMSQTGSTGNAAVSGNTFSLDFNFNPGYGYNGGTYTLAILYTLSNQ
jgi:hypothetical protein